MVFCQPKARSFFFAIPWSVAKRHHNGKHTCLSASIPQSYRKFIEATLTLDGGTRRLFIETTIIASAKMLNSTVSA